MSDCLVCGISDNYKPMCFKSEEYCCNIHKKMIEKTFAKPIEIIEVVPT